MTRPAPYSPVTRAKGWRFELDIERARQSDTWALAGPELRPWLLMLWAVAWEQTPAGSLPAEDALIAAHVGMPADRFIACKSVLMRGWWLADDGRLYHDVLVARVEEMETVRERERRRKAGYRARSGEGAQPNAFPTDTGQAPQSSDRVAPESDGCPAGQQGDSDGRDATGTGTYKEHSSGKPDMPGFARFWIAWPKSPRKVAKAECERRWRSRGLEMHADRIVHHVEAMSSTKQWRGGYDPAPLTYLNQRRWEDEVLQQDGDQASSFSNDLRLVGAL